MEIIFSIWTVLVCIIFMAITVWAYSSKRKVEFEEVARTVLEDDDQEPRHG